jgi:hypothetical protein
MVASSHPVNVSLTHVIVVNILNPAGRSVVGRKTVGCRRPARFSVPVHHVPAFVHTGKILPFPGERPAGTEIRFMVEETGLSPGDRENSRERLFNRSSGMHYKDTEVIELEQAEGYESVFRQNTSPVFVLY